MAGEPRGRACAQSPSSGATVRSAGGATGRTTPFLRLSFRHFIELSFQQLASVVRAASRLFRLSLQSSERLARVQFDGQPPAAACPASRIDRPRAEGEASAAKVGRPHPRRAAWPGVPAAAAASLAARRRGGRRHRARRRQGGRGRRRGRGRGRGRRRRPTTDDAERPSTSRRATARPTASPPTGIPRHGRPWKGKPRCGSA